MWCASYVLDLVTTLANVCQIFQIQINLKCLIWYVSCQPNHPGSVLDIFDIFAIFAMANMITLGV